MKPTFTSARGFRFYTKDDNAGASYHYGLLRRYFDQEVRQEIRNKDRLDILRHIQGLVSSSQPQADEPLDTWFRDMLKEHEHRDGHLRFLHDTLSFISMGRRRLPAAGYKALVEFNSGIDDVAKPRNVSIGDSQYDAYLRKLSDECIEILVDHESDLLQSWLQHEDGFMDLLNTFIFLLEEPANR